MNLVVTRQQFTVRADHQAGGADAVGVVAGQRQGAANQVDPVLDRQMLEPRLQGFAIFGFGNRQLVALVRAHQRKVFG